MRIKFGRNPYLTEAEKISYVQRRVLVHCILYYEMDMPVIGDADYDELAQQLEQMHRDTEPSEREKSRYWYCMRDFSASTGFDIPSKLMPYDKEHLHMVANAVRKAYENDKKQKEPF